MTQLVKDAVCWLPLASSVWITGSKSKIQIEIRFHGIVFSRKARNLDKSTLMLICIPGSSRSPQGYLSPESEFQQLPIGKGFLLASKASIILLKDIFEVWALEMSHSVPPNNISHISRITPPPPLLSLSSVLTQGQHQKWLGNPTWFKLGLWLDRFKTMTQSDFEREIRDFRFLHRAGPAGSWRNHGRGLGLNELNWTLRHKHNQWNRTNSESIVCWPISLRGFPFPVLFLLTCTKV